MVQARSPWALWEPRRTEADFRQRRYRFNERTRSLHFQHRGHQVPSCSGNPLQHPATIRTRHFDARRVRYRKVEAMKTRTSRATKNLESLEPFLAIRNEREYDAAVARLNALVDEVGDNAKDARYRLIETLSVLIEAYDREHHRLPEASGVEVLRFLVEEHGLTQKDLPEIGSQGVVSEVLAGRRRLNLRQIQTLAARFGVDPGTFIFEPRSLPRRHRDRASAS